HRERVCHRGQPPGGVSTGRWDPPALEGRAGRGPPGVPAAWLAALRQRCHTQDVALGVHGDAAQAAGKRVVLRPLSVGGLPVAPRAGAAWRGGTSAWATGPWSCGCAPEEAGPRRLSPVRGR